MDSADLATFYAVELKKLKQNNNIFLLQELLEILDNLLSSIKITLFENYLDLNVILNCDFGLSS